MKLNSSIVLASPKWVVSTGNFSSILDLWVPSFSSDLPTVKHSLNLKQLMRWSFVSPATCINVWMTVGPTLRNTSLNKVFLLIISSFGVWCLDWNLARVPELANYRLMVHKVPYVLAEKPKPVNYLHNIKNIQDSCWIIHKMEIFCCLSLILFLWGSHAVQDYLWVKTVFQQY